jgi:hypothetical protein
MPSFLSIRTWNPTNRTCSSIAVKPLFQSPTDFVSSRLLASRTFTFLVGPEKEPIDVHINLLRSLSEPLDKLMNNGTMKESTERVAVLEEVDVETFAQFAEFCYTRNYRAPPKAKPVEAVDGPNSTDAQMEEQNSPEISLPTKYCFGCGNTWASTVPQGPMYCLNCSNSTSPIYCVLCRVHHSVARSRRERHQPVCPTCCEKAEVKRINMWKDNTVILNRLAAKKYGAMDMNHDELRAHIKNLKPEDELSEKLVCHAKLYVFATIYMIQPLKELCLHKLSRDLEAFNFGNDFAGEFAELFRYVYVNTSGNDDATIGTGSELRDLVVTYAIYKAEFLIENKAFLEVLEEGGEGVSAFAVLLIKRI